MSQELTKHNLFILKTNARVSRKRIDQVKTKAADEGHNIVLSLSKNVSFVILLDEVPSDTPVSSRLSSLAESPSLKPTIDRLLRLGVSVLDADVFLRNGLSSSSLSGPSTSSLSSTSDAHASPDAKQGAGNGGATAGQKLARRNRKWETARIFISSTFRDMHGERDCLNKFVLPELQARCQDINVNVSMIDLRWGVVEDQAAQILGLCFDQIDQCRPFFVGLLGDRYGWVIDRPMGFDSSEDPVVYRELLGAQVNDPRYRWMDSEVDATGCSVTHLEIEHGLLQPLRKKSKVRGAICIRDGRVLSEVPLEHMQDFESESESNSRKLQSLKQKIRSTIAQNPDSGVTLIDQYSSHWAGVVEHKPQLGDLEGFGLSVLEALWRSIVTEFCDSSSSDADETASNSTDDFLREQRLIQDNYLAERSRFFVGRKQLLQDTTFKILNRPDAHSPLLIHGPPGSGKTALLAKAIEQGRANGMGNNIVVHSASADPGSATIQSTLFRLCRELVHFCRQNKVQSSALSASRKGATAEEAPSEEKDEDEGESLDPPSEYLELVEFFHTQITAVSKVLSQKGLRLSIIIDGVDQLDPSQNDPCSFEWLPEDLASQMVHFVISLSDDNARRRLQNKYPRTSSNTIELNTMGEADCKEIVRTRLWEYGKKLSDRQYQLLISKREFRSPLYLAVVCEELRVFGVYEQLDSKIESLPHGIKDLFQTILERLEIDFGEDLVRGICSSLAVSRNGLTEIEARTVLGAIAKAKHPDWVTQDGELIASRWAQLERGLKAFLRYSVQQQQYDFFQRQMHSSVVDRYGLSKGSVARLEVEKRLLQMHLRMADKKGDKSWDGPSRSISEAAFFSISSGEYLTFCDLATDLGFVESTCRWQLAFQMIGLCRDLMAGKEVLKKQLHGDEKLSDQKIQQVTAFFRFLKARAAVLQTRPELTFSAAESMADCMYPAIVAHSRWINGQENRPFMRLRNKPPTSDHCAMTLIGHQKIVKDVSVSPKTQMVTTVSDDKTLRLWDRETGRLLALAKTQRSAPHKTINCLGATWSKDEKFVVLRYSDSYYEVYSKNDEGNQIRLTHRHAGNFSSVANDCIFFKTHGSSWVFLAALKGGQMERLNVRNESATTEIVAHLCDLPTNAIDLSADGSFVAVATSSSECLVLSAETNNIIYRLKHKKPVTAVAFSKVPSSMGTKAPIILATGSDDKIIRVWKLPNVSNPQSATEETVRIPWKQFAGHFDGVTDVAFHPLIESLLVSSSHDNLIIGWDLERESPVRFRLVGHTGSVFKTRFSSNGSLLTTCSFDRSSKIWDVDSALSSTASTANPPSSSASSSSYSQAPKKMEDADHIHDQESESIGNWEGEEESSWGTEEVEETPEPVVQEKISADQETGRSESLGAAVVDKEVAARMLDLKFSHDGKWIIGASRDKSLRVWDSATATCQRLFLGHKSNVNGCDVSPDGQIVASASRDGSIGLWRFTDAKRLASFRHSFTLPKNSEVHTVSFLRISPSSSSSSSSKSRSSSSSSVALPDSLLLVSAGKDKTIRVWDVEKLVHLQKDFDKNTTEDRRDLTAKEALVKELFGHRDEVTCLAVSPSGAKILSGSLDGTLKMWDTSKNFRKVATFSGHKKLIECCAFSADEKMIISGSMDSTTIVWSAINAKVVHHFVNGHKEAVKGVGFSSDSSICFTSSTDHTLVAWRLSDFQPIASFACNGRITAMACSPLGNILSLSDGSGKLYVLDPVGLD